MRKGEGVKSKPLKKIGNCSEGKIRMGKENISPDTKEGYWVSLKNEAEVSNMLK